MRSSIRTFAEYRSSAKAFGGAKPTENDIFLKGYLGEFAKDTKGCEQTYGIMPKMDGVDEV